MKKSIATLSCFLILCVFLFVSCGRNSGEKTPCEFNFTTSDYATGEGEEIFLDFNGKNIETIKFTSSDSNVVEICSDGMVRGIKSGCAVVKGVATPSHNALSQEVVTDECNVHVNNGNISLTTSSKVVKWVGRNFDCDEGVGCYNSAGGLSVNFTGTKLKSFILSGGSKYTPEIAVLIDGDKDYSKKSNIINLAKNGSMGKEYVLAEGLPYGKHTARIFKITEAVTTSVIFKNLSTDGYFITRPKDGKYKFEIYGDSITVGYQNMRSQPEEKDVDHIQNALMTCAFLASEKMGADLSIFARIGIGMNSSWGDSFIMKDVWNKTYCSEYDYIHTAYNNPTWNFSERVDAVLFNIGTNDAWYNWNANRFKSETIKLIRNLRSIHGSETKIILIYGAMEFLHTGNAMVEIEEQLTAEGVENIFSVSLISSYQGHPRVEENVENGQILYDKLSSIFNI